MNVFVFCHHPDCQHKDIPDKTLFLTVSRYQGACLIYWSYARRARGVKFCSRDDRWSHGSIMSPIQPASSDHLHTNSVSQQRWMRPCGQTPGECTERHRIQTPLWRLRREGYIYTQRAYASTRISHVTSHIGSVSDRERSLHRQHHYTAF